MEPKYRRRTIKELQGLDSDHLRLICQDAVDRSWQKARSASIYKSAILLDDDILPPETASVQSSERAVQRGSLRALRECNETEDVTTTVEDNKAQQQEIVPSTPTKRRKRKNSKKNRVADDSSASSGDAWMCGVCGKVFSKHQACKTHEERHIKRVVENLSWIRNKKNVVGFVNTPAAGGHETSHNRNDRTTQFFPVLSYRESRMVLSSDTLIMGNTRQHRHDRVSLQQVDIPDRPRSKSDGILLVPKPRARTHSSEVRFDLKNEPFQLGTHDEAEGTEYDEEEEGMLLSSAVRDYMVPTDEALLDVCKKAESMILSEQEIEAEQELKWLAQTKGHYDEMMVRACASATTRYRTEGNDVWGKLQNKFIDAYQLMKEGGDGSRGITDQYTKKKKDVESEQIIQHSEKTLYVNVMVKNSVHVVRHELERLARKRWETADEQVEKFTRFQRFRVYAHANIVKLAGIALASDFTPRRIAVQLSNDLYRLLTPRLKRRGVSIEAEIEYRVGPYFVLAVNISRIDWHRLVKATHRDVAFRRAKWHRAEEEEGHVEKNVLKRGLKFVLGLFQTSKFDMMAQFFFFLYFFHWMIYLPTCVIAYYTFWGSTIRHFIISSVTDEIFFYVERKGMEMEIKVCRSEMQAAFMLSALRELRADGRELKKKREETETQQKGIILGPLLGPAIKVDSGPAVKPPGFEVPDNLEFVGLELELPVGFRRLRWAYLHRDSRFILDALYKTEARYENISVGHWNKHDDVIGSPELPQSVPFEDLIGAEKEGSYLMPKSAFVSANMCYETHFLIAYNDYCFCVKKRSRNPEAPFGRTFVAWTQYLVINLGNNSCKLFCSVEAEFPNGEPMVSRQIRSGMRAGTGELFVLTGETITKYADEFP